MSDFLSWLINRCNTSVSFSFLPPGEDTLGLEVKDGSILGAPGEEHWPTRGCRIRESPS